MVTIVSDTVYREMKPNPPCLKVVALQTVGRDIKMDVGPVSLKLGNTTFPEVVHVAPIQDDMLLGLDFRAADERVPPEAVNSKMEQNPWQRLLQKGLNKS